MVGTGADLLAVDSLEKLGAMVDLPVSPLVKVRCSTRYGETGQVGATDRRIRQIPHGFSARTIGRYLRPQCRSGSLSPTVAADLALGPKIAQAVALQPLLEIVRIESTELRTLVVSLADDDGFRDLRKSGHQSI